MLDILPYVLPLITGLTGFLLGLFGRVIHIFKFKTFTKDRDSISRNS